MTMNTAVMMAWDFTFANRYAASAKGNSTEHPVAMAGGEVACCVLRWCCLGLDGQPFHLRCCLGADARRGRKDADRNSNIEGKIMIIWLKLSLSMARSRHWIFFFCFVHARCVLCQKSLVGFSCVFMCNLCAQTNDITDAMRCVMWAGWQKGARNREWLLDRALDHWTVRLRATTAAAQPAEIPFTLVKVRLQGLWGFSL